MPSNMDVFLIPEQKYSISLDLIVPRDKTNLQVGLFMTCLTLKNGNHSQVMSKICKSAILPHRTSIYVLKWSLFPFQVSIPLPATQENNPILFDRQLRFIQRWFILDKNFVKVPLCKRNYKNWFDDIFFVESFSISSSTIFNWCYM